MTPMLDFQNTERAFKLRSNHELKSAKFLFQSISNPALVRWGSGLALWSLKNRLPVKGIIRATVFRQFCGGESIPECSAVIERMHALGVQAILDYSAEGKSGDTDFENTKNITLQTIDYASTHAGVPLAVFKPTGLGRIEIWTAVSEGRALSASEEAEWKRVVKRVETLCAYAADKGVPLMFDAEESWMQQAADDLCLEMMRRFNTDRPIIYNTLQMYRHDRLAYLHKLDGLSAAEGFHVGLKIVRGAYMEKERERAKKRNYPSPIQATKAATDRDYNAACQYILDRIDRFALVAGTHNEDSSRLLADAIAQKGLPKHHPRIYFSQLYGMSDHISYNLAAEGYPVVKYLPFGPVENVMPYLIRRAEENTSVEGQSGRELQLIHKELNRRKKR